MALSPFTFKEKLWRWPGEGAAWHFVNVPKKISEKVRESVPKKRGFGSVRVVATIGKTSWKTSIFPESKSSTYLLPVKSSVRKAEGIFDGDYVKVTCKIL